MDSWVRFSAQSQAKERVMSLIQIFSTDDVITPKLVQQEHIRCDRPCGGEAFMKSLADLRSALTLTYCQDCGTGGFLLNISVHRVGQYTCMLLGYTLQRSKVSTELIRTVGDLEAHLSITRKLIRLGNSVDALQAAKRSIHLSDSVLRLCLTISHLNRAMYFACDNVLWAGKTGLVSKLDQKKWSQRSFRYYLFALILNLTRDLYELGLLLDSETRYQSTKGPLSPADPSSLPVWLPGRLRQILMVLHNNPPLLLDLLKNSCDVFIPLDRLGIYPTGPGFVGTCGLVSSVLSIMTMVQPWLKLKP